MSTLCHLTLKMIKQISHGKARKASCQWYSLIFKERRQIKAKPFLDWQSFSLIFKLTTLLSFLTACLHHPFLYKTFYFAIQLPTSRADQYLLPVSLIDYIIIFLCLYLPPMIWIFNREGSIKTPLFKNPKTSKASFYNLGLKGACQPHTLELFLAPKRSRLDSRPDPLWKVISP